MYRQPNCGVISVQGNYSHEELSAYVFKKLENVKESWKNPNTIRGSQVEMELSVTQIRKEQQHLKERFFFLFFCRVKENILLYFHINPSVVFLNCAWYLISSNAVFFNIRWIFSHICTRIIYQHDWQANKLNNKLNCNKDKQYTECFVSDANSKITQGPFKSTRQFICLSHSAGLKKIKNVIIKKKRLKHLI